MKRLVAGLALALLVVVPVAGAASISVDQPPPYHWGDTVTLTVEVPKLKGYEYPVVYIRCVDSGNVVWTYWRRWDGEGPLAPWGSGPEPVLLGKDAQPDVPLVSSDCHVALRIYAGLHNQAPYEVAGVDIHVDP